MIDVAVAANDRYVPWCAHAHALVPGPPRGGELQIPPALARTRLARTTATSCGRWSERRRRSSTRGRPRSASGPAADRRYGRTVWLRLLLPELLADQARVLYLDADTFVVEPPSESCGRPTSPAPRWRRSPTSCDRGSTTTWRSSGSRSRRVLQQRGAADGPGALAHAKATTEPSRRRRARAASSSGPTRTCSTRSSRVAGTTCTRAGTRRTASGPGPRRRGGVRRPRSKRRRRTPCRPLRGAEPDKPWHYLADHPWRDAYRRTLAATPRRTRRSRTGRWPPGSSAAARATPGGRVLALQRWRGRRRGTGTVTRT